MPFPVGLDVISHQVRTRLEGRGFSPAAIAAPRACPSRSPSSLRPQAARGTGRGVFRKSL
jgi:hypothetical protein